ncbi:MAG: hypothetical protein ACMXX7_02095 [Candidatus Woesearchaeota archaeon]
MKNKKRKSKLKNNSYLTGIYYGLLPHSICIIFIIASIIGATFFTNLLRPLMLSTAFFYGLVIISILFATIGAFFYLRQNKLLSLKGIKFKWRYLSLLYGLTIGVNLLLFLFIFPLVSNIGGSIGEQFDSQVTLKVDIPCSGHAPLILSELRNNGFEGKYLMYEMADGFEVYFDSSTQSLDDILDLDVFNYFATEIMS